MRDVRTTAAVICLLLLAGWAPGAAAQTSPSQPTSGPGGSNYPHASMTTSGPFYAGDRTARKDLRYFIYEPALPKPASAPVVLFLHGWLATDPDPYIGWIRHMVRKGYVVVWAQYQYLATPQWAFADNALDSWNAALGRLETGTHVRPAKDAAGQAKTAFIGHSVGGYLSALLGARAASPFSAVPSPYAIVSIEPGGVDIVPGADLGAIPPETKLLIVVGDEDDIACKSTAVAVWGDTPQIAGANRDFLLVRSDRHGSPAQIANHYFPNTSGFRDTAAEDARDFYITYKLSVAALNCVFKATKCGLAFGNGKPKQLDMGAWSDLVPVTPMVAVSDPASLSTTCIDP